ncbi:MAG: hypothetical protein E6R03_02150 [Hyphomicrobiaceae bacterium]|nr:MAG: hypothetical protein E6R03_02150 [Hyphomicrobiaceae bacterium]
MTLRREPTSLEALVIKAIDDLVAAESQNEFDFLANQRERWLARMLAALGTVEADYFNRISAALTIDPEEVAAFGEELARIAEASARLIPQEIRDQGGAPASGLQAQASAWGPAMNVAAGALLGALASEIATRAMGAAKRAAAAGESIPEAIRADAQASNLAYVDRVAKEATNVAVGAGRAAELEARTGEYEYLVYSAILDKKTCGPCAEADGKGGQLANLPVPPNPKCLGGLNCRCVLIPVFRPSEPGPGPEPDPVPPTPPAPAPPAPESTIRPGRTIPEAQDTGLNARKRLARVEQQYSKVISSLAQQAQQLQQQASRATGSEQLSAITVKLTQLRGQRAQLIEEFAEEARYQIRRPMASKVSVESTGFEGVAAATLEESLTAFRYAIGDWMDATQTRPVKLAYSTDRAWYSRPKNLASVDGSLRHVAHELGHWIEYENPGDIGLKVRVFWARRTLADTWERLADLTGFASYGDEVTRKDKFFDPYMGKIYVLFGELPTEEQVAALAQATTIEEMQAAGILATEVLSMGLELLAYDPVRLAKADPELFDLLYEAIRGK